MNDRYFLALGWIGLALAVTVEAFDRGWLWVRRELRMLWELRP